MPSFFSKIFGRKKDKRTSSSPSRGRESDGSLLDGKFEAVSPVNTRIDEFPENALVGSGREKVVGSGLSKVKSQRSQSFPTRGENFPQLSLTLPAPKDDAQTSALGVVFEAGPDVQILTDDAIGSKLLTPSETLILVRICSRAIIARGLETLGLMHPHWYSSSPDIQRRLISLFIHSLNPNNAITILPPSLSSSSSLFESEIDYTRSPHDVAAVLRWGLRHLELNGEKFGKDEFWYKAFSEAERSSEYLAGSYSTDLAPLIPPEHLELLNVILDLFSSLAAHAEKNGTSASKLTRAFGFWLLAAPRVGGDHDDWPKFYARWQDNGWILEHLLLARIRDESLRLRMPTRLTELVVQYPYVRGAASADDVFLPPRVSSRNFDALFVRVETEFSSSQDQVRCHPLRFLKDALAADVVVGKSELSTLWEKIRNMGSDENLRDLPGLSQVFADETIRYLALIPGDHPLKRVASSTLSVPKTQQIPGPRRYVSSPGSSETVSNDRALNGHREPRSSLPTVAKSVLPTDWAQFSSAGFSNVSAPLPLASTLFGQDVEKTNPPLRKASRHSMVSSPSRSPSEIHKSPTTASQRRTSNPSQSESPIKFASRSYPLSVVEIDEAFIEFWVDALLDPVASMWRKFIICKLRPSLSELTIEQKRVQYVVVEQVFVPKPTPQAPTIEVAHSQPVEMARAMSLDKSTVASSLGRLSINSERSRFFGLFSSSGRHSSYGSPITFMNTKGSSNNNRKKTSSAHHVSDVGEVLEGSVNGEKTKPSSLFLAVNKSELKKSVDGSELAGISSKEGAGNDKDASDKVKEETKKEGLNSDVAVADPDAAVTVTDAAEVRDQLLPGGGSTKTAIGDNLNQAARVSEQAMQEGKSEALVESSSVPEEALAPAEPRALAAVEGLMYEETTNAPSTSASAVQASEIAETAMTVPGPEAISKEGAPGLADISARDIEEPVEKTATVQVSSIDAIEQTEGDSEMKTVSDGSEAAAALPKHVDSKYGTEPGSE